MPVRRTMLFPGRLSRFLGSGRLRLPSGQNRCRSRLAMRGEDDQRRRCLLLPSISPDIREAASPALGRPGRGRRVQCLRHPPGVALRDALCFTPHRSRATTGDPRPACRRCRLPALHAWREIGGKWFLKLAVGSRGASASEASRNRLPEPGWPSSPQSTRRTAETRVTPLRQKKRGSSRDVVADYMAK